MKLTNKQLAIVVDEIYINVSQPIIDRNEEIKENIILPKEPIMRDKVKYDKIMAEYSELQSQANVVYKKALTISKKYEGVSLNGFSFTKYNDVFGGSKYENDRYENYITHRNNQLAEEKYSKYPSRSDIERKVILSETKELGELIDSLIKEYTK